MRRANRLAFLCALLITFVVIFYHMLSSPRAKTEPSVYHVEFGETAYREGFLRQAMRIRSRQGVIKMQASSKHIPVYVVEEHHEVIPVWFEAANKGKLPQKTSNVLIHIDAHSDAGTPHLVEGFPAFRWPNISELSMLMSRNDKFIMSAGLTGLLSRYVWVWPQWTFEDSMEMFYSEHITADVTFGMWTHSNAMTASVCQRFCVCGRITNPPEDWGSHLKDHHCYRYEHEDEEKDPIDTPRDECKEISSVRIDILSENKMVDEMLPGGSLDFTDRSLSNGFILDIDEDYFGCEASVMPLYNVGLEEKSIRYVSFWVDRFFCGMTADIEFAADSVFQKIVQFSIENRQLCKDLKQGPEKLSNPCLQRLYQKLNSASFTTLNNKVKLKLNDVVCKKNDTKFIKLRLFWFLKALAPFSDTQLRAFADIGVCFKTSPDTYDDPEVNHFHLCDGYNRPNHTAVIFHTPDEHEVEVRGRQLLKILRQLPSAPDVVTVCRSVRDGYTPRSRFHQIETRIMDILHDVYAKNDLEVNFHRNLMGGRNGWPGRQHFDD